MNAVQIGFIVLFIYLGSMSSIVGSTIGWYTLGRPLIAAFVTGIILRDVNSAMLVGIPLQVMYLVNVTPGGAVAWDLSYATYIGTAGAILFGKGMDATGLLGLALVFAGIGGLVGQLTWNVSYALNLPLNRMAQRYAKAGAVHKMHIPNVILGQTIGFLCRTIPALIVLTSMTAASQQADFAKMIPKWFTTALNVFGGMMAALGMGIILSFLWKKQHQIVIFLAGFILITYFQLSTMSAAVIGIIAAVLYYCTVTAKKEAD